MNKSLSLTVCLLSVIVLSNLCGAFPSSRQLLPEIPGYVPVYIRNGDTPLEDINLDLAEAFHAIPSGRSAAGKDAIEAEPEQNDEPESLPEAVPDVESDNTDYNVKKDADEKKNDGGVAVPIDTTEDGPKATQDAIKPKEEVIDEVQYLPDLVDQ